MTKTFGAIGAAAVLGAGLVGWWWNESPDKTVPAGGPADAAPGQAGTSVSPYEIGIWDVQYRDAQLGVVSGKGFIDWEHKKARVELTDPRSGTVSKMSTRQFDLNDTKDGARLSLELDGPSPSSETMDAPATKGLAPLATTDGAAVSVTPPDPGFHAVVHDKAAAELNRIHVSLQAGPTGVMSGLWTYNSDPLTERDRNGSGRNGVFRMLAREELESKYEGFLGLNAETETWSPRPPAVVAVAVLENQLGYNQSRVPMFPYPFRDNVPPDRRDQINFRTLMIAGKDLPVDGYKLLQKINFSENEIANVSQLGGPNDAEGLTQAQYRLLGVKGDPSLDAATLKLFEQGWQEISVGRPAQDQAELRKLDAVIVRVTLKPGVLPGAKTFTWGGGIGSWGLQFGDAIAEARFVRKVRSQVSGDSASADQFERTSVAYLPESIVAEIETNLAFDSLSVMYTLKSNPNAGGSVEATQIRPGLYHATINLLEQSGRGPTGEGVPLQAAVGDEVLITVDRRAQNVEFVSDPLAAAKIARSPGVKTAYQAGKLWKEELAAAASCKGIQVTDWSTGSGQKADEIANTAIFELKRRKTPITIGEHAAMLLLRDTFTDMLERQKSVLLDMTSDEAVRSYREGIKRAVVATGDSPMAAITVTGPSGGKVPFIETLDDDYGAGNYTGPDAVSGHLAWQLKATREAVTQYAAAIDASMKEASAIKDCDTQGLLKLTGAGFQNVVNDATPRLMKLADTSSTNYQWVPDLPARSQVAQLKSVAEAVRAQSEYASIGHDLAIGIALAPLGLAGKVGRVVMSAVAVLQVNVEAAHVIWERYQNQEEVQFEFGASSVLGTERLAAAQMKKSEWWVKVAMLAGNAVLTAFDVKALASEIGTEMAVAGGRSLWPSVDRGGVGVLRAMGGKQQRQVMEYLAELRMRVRSGHALTPEDAAAVARAREMAAELEEQAASRTAVLEPFEEPGAKTAGADVFVPPGNTQVRSTSEFPTGYLKDAPHANGAWLASQPGAASDALVELGNQLGEPGSWCTTYELLNDARRPDIRKITFLNGEVVDSPVVAKVLHSEVYEFRRWWAVEAGVPGAAAKYAPGELGRISREFSTEVIERIRGTQQMLEKDGILHLPIVEFHPEAAQPYMVQMKFPPNSADFRMFGAKDLIKNGKVLSYGEASKTFTPEMQEAYVQMIQKFTRNDHIPLDLSLGNVFFKRVNGKWEAGVVDIDLVMAAKNPAGFPAEFADELKYLRSREIFSQLGENPRVWKAKPDGSWDAEIFNEKMFEYPYPGNGRIPFVRFNPTADDFERVLIDPALIRKYFPNLRGPKVAKKASLSFHPPWPFGGFPQELAAAA